MTEEHKKDERLETPKQLAKRVGISDRQIRQLVQTGKLDHVMIGCRVHIPDGAFGRFLASSMVRTCQDETKGRDCGGSRSAIASTSPGPSTVAAASARLARQTANRLKLSSQNGCSTEDPEQAQVIPLQSSLPKS